MSIKLLNIKNIVLFKVCVCKGGGGVQNYPNNSLQKGRKGVQFCNSQCVLLNAIYMYISQSLKSIYVNLYFSTVICPDRFIC